MDRLRRPPIAGAVASVLAAALVLLPYALPDVSSPAVATYYDYGLLGGWSVLVLALVAAVAFASGSQGRTEPDTVAGASIVFGSLALVLAVMWALAVPYGVVAQLTALDWFAYHRHALVAATAAVVAAGAWYAVVLDVV